MIDDPREAHAMKVYEEYPAVDLDVEWHNVVPSDKLTPKSIINTIQVSMDFYHQQDWENSPGWASFFVAGLDLLERVLGLPENSLALSHDSNCDCERPVAGI